MGSEDFSNEEREWNTSEKIYQDEYNSILQIFYDKILRPIVQQNKNLDRDILKMAISDLEFKIDSEEFNDIPIKIKNAYTSLNKLIKVMKESDNKEINANKNLLYAVFGLAIGCTTFSIGGMDIYRGRNPCREHQYELKSELMKAKKNKQSNLVNAVGYFSDICVNCLHR